MSIQDEISRINGAVSTQAGLIEQISTVLTSKSGGGGGEDITVVPLTVTENKTYTAPSGTAFNPVTANVPAPTLNLETVELTPSDSIQTRIAAPGFDAIRQVSVLPVPTATYIKRSELAEVRTVAAKPADGTGKNGDLFIMLG